MFKRKKPKDADRVGADTVKPADDPVKREVDKTILRAARLQSLVKEQQMWADFAAGCKDGRRIYEDPRYPLYGYVEGLIPRLYVVMDVDTAPVWRDFALRMAADRERRLKDMLGA